MDISSLKPSERMIDMVHPGDETPLGIKVTILSISDARLKPIKRKIQDEKLRLDARGKHLRSEDIDANQNALIFAAMTGWEWQGDANFNGKKPEFTRAAVYEVLDALPWFADQLSRAISEEKDFFG